MLLGKGFAVLLLAVLAGCVSTPADIGTAARAKPTSYLDPSFLVKDEGKGTIRIVRDGGFIGSAGDVFIYIDGRHVANVDSNTVLELYVPAGPVKVGLQANSVSFPIQYRELTVEAGGTYDYRVSMYYRGTTSDWRFERLK